MKAAEEHINFWIFCPVANNSSLTSILQLWMATDGTCLGTVILEKDNLEYKVKDENPWFPGN
ncbi:hypothetical protein R6Q59_029777 [Mikania micrantha]